MRIARWAFILFQCVWLNAVLPGHTRGAITLPGARPAMAGAHGCCGGAEATDPSAAAAGDKHRRPTPWDRAHCAICYFAAGLSTPPPALDAPSPGALVGLAPTPAAIEVVGVRISLPFHGRAPPAA